MTIHSPPRAPHLSEFARRLLSVKGSIAAAVVAFVVAWLLAVFGDVSVLGGILAALVVAGLTLLVLLALRANRLADRAIAVAQLASSRAAAAQVTPLLYQKIDPPYPLPPLGDEILDANAFLFVADWIAARRPKLLVELGSGASTPVFAHLMKRVGGRVISVEHDPLWVERTREEVRQWKLDDTAEIFHVPLTKAVPPGAFSPWYDPEALQRVLATASIDLLIVDGPPGAAGRLARYPALPTLRQRLAPGCAILLDDCQRPDEQEILRRWREEMPDFESVLLRGNKRAAVLSAPGQAPAA